ncbi:PEP-CTERM sorting domain-containing protein [Thermodesulfobacteriota bacterium]
MKYLNHFLITLALFYMLFFPFLPIAHAYSLSMIDVDKPTGSPTTYDNYGRFTNINNNWTGTCWQAISASILNFAGYGTTNDIYTWFHTTYGNVGTDSHLTWRDAINGYINETGHQSSKGEYKAFSTNAPEDDWAETMIHNTAIGLAVSVSGYLQGRHAIAYSGYDETNDWSWVADPDADWRSESLPQPANYLDWSLFDDVTSATYNWKLARTWSDNTQLYYDVEGAVFLQPIPEPITIFLLGSGLIGLAGFRRRFREK